MLATYAGVFILLLVSRLPVCAGGQDSLIALLDNRSGTEKANLLNEIAYEYYLESEYDNALEYLAGALALSDSTGYEKGRSEAFLTYGEVYYDLGKNETAIYYYEKSIPYKKESGDRLGISYCYNVIGVLYRKNGMYDRAMEYAQKSLDIAEEINSVTRAGYAYTNIGHIYYSMRQFGKALENYEKSCEYAILDSSKDDEADAYINIGIAWYELKDPMKSVDYSNRALQLFRETGNKHGQALALNNIANRNTELGSYDIALNYHLQGMAIERELENREGMAYSYANIAEVFRGRRDYKTCLSYMDSALAYTREKELTLKIYDSLTFIHEEMGNSAMALFYHRKYSSLRDSIINERSNMAVAELATIYQTEKKEKENEILRKDQAIKNETIRRQGIVTFAVAAGLFLVLLLAVVLFRSNRQRRKANILLSEQNEAIRQQKEEISAQRDEIEAQRDQVTKQKEHIEKQKKEIDDSIRYARRIQAAVLPVAGSLPLDHFILFKPRNVVSGDFYWSTKIGEWQIVAVADCTGHGVPGAFMSMLGVSFLNEIVRKKEVVTAAKVLDELRISVIDALKQTTYNTLADNSEQERDFLSQSSSVKDGMDISIAAINTEKGMCSWAGANNPLYMIRNGILEEIKPDKMPVSIHIRMDHFTDHTINISKGDRPYLFTDGLPDQFGGPKGGKFKYKTFRELLL
ncbi:MAG: tetratricopeptide repeat protein, partial [Bacteroidota bacterium]